ncbi:hypothetical protein AURDEDRAFT_175160 [Auricularia subglabra TFB-10046 SS5]|nr:hypothetical protein AURDEDRAFT_175160 [Auricularia subglabra TFB-10046 SS5]
MLLLPLFLTPVFAARLANVTIDDTFGDERTGRLPDYQSSDSWVPMNERSLPAVGANWTRVQNRTWAGTGDRSAVYVFFVTIEGEVAPLKFTLDDAVDPQHVSPRSNGTGEPFSYNQLVFKDTSLAHGAHTLQITVSKPGFGFLPGAIFDYATYTASEEDTGPAGVLPGSTRTSSVQLLTPSATPLPGKQTSARPRRGAKRALAPSLAALPALTTMGILIVYWRRRKRRKATGRPQPCRNVDDSIAPFEARPHEGTVEAVQDRAVVLNTIETETLDRADSEALPVQAVRDVTHLRAALERMRDESELLRRIAEPPPRYSGTRAANGRP